MNANKRKWNTKPNLPGACAVRNSVQSTASPLLARCAARRGAGGEVKSRSFMAIGIYVSVLTLFLWNGVSVLAQSKTQSVVAASSLPELPLKGWGPYARANLAPCCLIGQPLRQQFVFPIVISQQQAAMFSQRVRGATGVVQTRLTPVMAQRRGVGLSPVRAGADDRGASGPFAALNRRAQMVDADGEGTLWTTRIRFAPAGWAANRLVAAAPSASAASAWGEGEATIECFPAFAEPAGDGLLIRVTLVNPSSQAQLYGVDLLGSMDTPGLGFGSEDLQIQAEAGTSAAIIQHNKSRAVFALAGPSAAYRTHSYRVSDAYFGADGNVARRSESGALLPAGVLASSTPQTGPNSDAEADKKEQIKQAQREKAKGKREQEKADKANKNRTNKDKDQSRQAEPGANEAVIRKDNAVNPKSAIAAPPDAAVSPQTDRLPDDALPTSEGQYALTRVDSVEVPAGQSVTLYLSIGVGSDADTARDAAQTLLHIADGAKNGRAGSGSAYLAALKAHEAARPHTGVPAIDELMAQMFANAPNMDEQRIGVGTRLRVNARGALYEPSRDGLMALGWIDSRPDFAAAQLNAWFQTRTDPDALSGIPLRNPRAVVPTNLFALWELFQRTHDRPLLKRYYPYAQRRYQELLAAGRIAKDGWLFAWPGEARDGVFLPGSLPPGMAANSVLLAVSNGDADANAASLVAAPDYAAYLIASARIMRALAELTDQPAEEIHEYVQDAVEIIRALNTTLWDADRKVYAPRPQGAKPQPFSHADTLAGLLPLMAGAGAQTPEQRAFLLRALTDPMMFWSPFGLRSVSHTSPNYHANDGANGAIRYGLNWLFWKTLLDAGETETAHKLASNLLQGYVRAQSATGLCPEWLNGDTGVAGGVSDYAGDAGALLFLWAAYHQPGTLNGGWNVNILDHAYDRQKDTAHIILKRLQPTGVVNALCVMGKPNGKYLLTGAITGMQTADEGGVLTLTLPQDNTTLVVDVTPQG